MHTRVVVSMVAVLLLGAASMAAAETAPADPQSKPTMESTTPTPPAPEVKSRPGARIGDQKGPSARTPKLLECRARTRAQGFGFNFYRRGRFMRACMAGRV